jgi:hypothetical protein
VLTGKIVNVSVITNYFKIHMVKLAFSGLVTYVVMKKNLTLAVSLYGDL